MEQSELTGQRSNQIQSGGRNTVQYTSKQIDSFWLVLGLAWVYLATEGIISLASLMETQKYKWNGHLQTRFRFLQIVTVGRPFLDDIILLFIKLILVFGSWLGNYHKYGTYLAISHSSIEKYYNSAYFTDSVCLLPIYTDVIA